MRQGGRPASSGAPPRTRVRPCRRDTDPPGHEGRRRTQAETVACGDAHKRPPCSQAEGGGFPPKASRVCSGQKEAGFSSNRNRRRFSPTTCVKTATGALGYSLGLLLTWVATCAYLRLLSRTRLLGWPSGLVSRRCRQPGSTPSPKHHPQLTHMGKEGGRLGPEGRDVRRGARLMVRDAASGCLKHPGRTLCLSAGDAATPTKGCSRKGERLPLHARTRTMTPSPCSEAERGDGRKRVRRERHGCAHEGVLTQRRARRLQGTPGRAP